MTTSAVPAALTGQRIAVVDVEGNGCQPPEIIEIAVLTLDDGVTSDNLRTWLVRPCQPITALVTRKVHGISNAHVAGSPAWTEIANEVADALTGRALIAHNASVEHKVLSTHLPAWQPPMILDTLRLARHVWPGLPSYSLDRLIIHAGLDDTDTTGAYHRAGWDTWMTGQLLLTLVEQAPLDWPGLVTVAGLPGFGQPDELEGGLW